jgi:hypothetical protein
MHNSRTTVAVLAAVGCQGVLWIVASHPTIASRRSVELALELTRPNAACPKVFQWHSTRVSEKKTDRGGMMKGSRGLSITRIALLAPGSSSQAASFRKSSD